MPLPIPSNGEIAKTAEAVSEVACKLLDKIGDAAGVIFEPHRIERKARAEARAEQIRALSKWETEDELERRAVVRLVVSARIKQDNIERIARAALPELNPSADPSNLSNDWIASFFAECENVSDSDMQTLWARILAGEANKPGSFSKSTIKVVSAIEREDAALFTALCGFAWNLGGNYSHSPLIYVHDEEDDIYKEGAIDFESLSRLAELGLIHYDPITSPIYNFETNVSLIAYFDEVYERRPIDTRGTSIGLGSAVVTQAGRQLAPICGASPVPGFSTFIRNKLMSLGMSVIPMTGLAMNGDMQIVTR